MLSPDMVAGFALAALLDGDREAEAIRSQVPRAFHAAVRERLLELRSVDAPHDKRDLLALWIQRVRPEPKTLSALPKSAQEVVKRAAMSRGASAGAIDLDLAAMLKRLAARLESRGDR